MSRENLTLDEERELWREIGVWAALSSNGSPAEGGASVRVIGVVRRALARARAEGAAEEREACATIHDSLSAKHANKDHGGNVVACEFSDAYNEYRDAIRARGEGKVST